MDKIQRGERCKSAVDLFNAVTAAPTELPPAGKHNVKIVNATEEERDNGEPMIRLVLEVAGYRTFLGHLTFDKSSELAVAAFKASIGVKRKDSVKDLIGRIGYAELDHRDGYCVVAQWLIGND